MLVLQIKNKTINWLSEIQLTEPQPSADIVSGNHIERNKKLEEGGSNYFEKSDGRG